MASIPGACVYTSAGGILYATTQLLVYVVPLIVTAISYTYDPRSNRWGRQFLYLWFGWWLFLCDPALYLFQVALNSVRADPFCPVLQTYAVPSSVAFYVAATVSFMLLLAWKKRFWYAPLNMLWLVLWVGSPPAVLVWFGINTWQEVLVSMILGAIVTWIYMEIVFRFAVHYMPYLLVQAPCTFFSCLDTLVQSDLQQIKSEQLRRWFEGKERTYGSLDLLGC